MRRTRERSRLAACLSVETRTYPIVRTTHSYEITYSELVNTPNRVWPGSVKAPLTRLWRCYSCSASQL